ncbi:MAG: hypothetical protein MN733_17295 [Nitrososphaera sp.]|nr:hypothetical protein [Nitrososphaera sp.]
MTPQTTVRVLKQALLSANAEILALNARVDEFEKSPLWAVVGRLKARVDELESRPLKTFTVSRTVYMREYMRRRRAQSKVGHNLK